MSAPGGQLTHGIHEQGTPRPPPLTSTVTGTGSYGPERLLARAIPPSHGSRLPSRNVQRPAITHCFGASRYSACRVTAARRPTVVAPSPGPARSHAVAVATGTRSRRGPGASASNFLGARDACAAELRAGCLRTSDQHRRPRRQQLSNSFRVQPASAMAA